MSIAFKRVTLQDENDNYIGNTSNPLATKIVDTNGNTAGITSDGQLHVVMEGKLDPDNSTATPLLANETFTGEWVEILPYAYIAITMKSDVDSAVGGVTVQYSPDGVEVREGESYTIYADTEESFTPPAWNKYYRVKYVNGASDQSEFYIDSVLKKTAIKPSSHNLNENLGDGDDATLNLAVLKLRTAQDNYVTGAATESGNFKVSLEEYDTAFTSDPLPVRDFNLSVARGQVTDTKCVSKFGAAPSGIQTTYTDIWSRADATPTQQIWLAPTAARIHTIASTSASDTTGGTGVNTVIVYYLPDWDTAETTETVTGNLNAGIAMNNSAVIIHRMVVVPQSTTTVVGGNAGTITATAATDATITAVILPSEGQTEMAIYGVPSTQDFYLTRWNANIDKTAGVATSADFELRVNPNPNVQTLAFIRKEDISLQSNGTSMFEKRYSCYPKFSGPCIIKVQAIASAADLDGESGFDGFLVTK